MIVVLELLAKSDLQVKDNGIFISRHTKSYQRNISTMSKSGDLS